MPDHEEETEGETSLDEILATRAQEESEDDEEQVFDLDGDEKAETLTVRVIPQQRDEFTCTRCFLVKHQSQLVDRRKVLCRDCA